VVEMNQRLRVGSDIEPSPDMLNEALRKAVRLAPHDVLIVIISDFFGVDAQTERLAASLAAHNDVLGLLVHDPLRLNPQGHSISVSDGNLQMQMDLGNKKVREKLAEDYRLEQERITHFLKKMSAPLLLVSNEGDVIKQVKRLLGVPARGA